MAEELWQEYNEQGEPMGDGLAKAKAKSGVLHGAAHIWIHRQTSRGIEVAAQLRSATMKNWPLYYDVSAAGHQTYGDTPLQAAKRELQEELSIIVQSQQLKLLFVYHQKIVVPSSNTIENEWQWVYGLEVQDEWLQTVAKNREVDGVEWFPVADLADMAKGKTEKKFVKHGDLYFTNLSVGLQRLYEDN